MNTITLSVAIEGYFLNAAARRLSPKTIEFYRYIFNNMLAYFTDDPPIASVTTTRVQQFLASLTHLSDKSLLGHHAGLSALWKWAAKERLVERNIIRDIEAPRPEEHVVNPFTEAEIKSLLAAIDKSKPYSRPGKRECQNSNPTALRNRVIIYVLLDTGVRSDELCSAQIKDADLKTRKLLVMGKRNKERLVPFSANTGQLMWRYLASRKTETVDAWLFPSVSGRKLSPNELYHALQRIGKRAGVSDVHPHRFRHTFAIQYLRNHGDVYTLQSILGHTTLEMVRHYLKIAQADIDEAHRQASPVANWRL